MWAPCLVLENFPAVSISFGTHIPPQIFYQNDKGNIFMSHERSLAGAWVQSSTAEGRNGSCPGSLRALTVSRSEP